jgi:hypothetical protein
MAVFTVVANVVLVLAALVTVWFAAKAAASGAEATRLAKDSLVYSRETVEAVRAAHDADERDRRRMLVREIDGLVEVIHAKAKLITSGTPSGSPGCSVPEQGSLARLLVGAREDLPHCAAASVPGPAVQVLVAARLAKTEVAAALEELKSTPVR